MKSTAGEQPTESAPLLTVVVPTHNVATWIDECLTSIRRQKGVDLEIIIIDDHSSDSTLELVARHAHVDARIRVVRSTARGGGSARNLGASLVRTPYLAFADGDDIVPPGAYSALVGSLERSGSDLVVGNFLKFDALRTWQPSLRWRVFGTEKIGFSLNDVPMLIRNRACWNRVFRTDFWRKSNVTFPDVPRSNDIFPMTTALVAARTLDVIPEFVYLYRDRPGSDSMSARAGESESVLSYLDQEIRCAELIGMTEGELSAAYSALVLDADGWVHLTRYLGALTSAGNIDPAVIAAASRLVSAVGPGSPTMQVLRRATWAAVQAGRGDIALDLISLDDPSFWDTALVKRLWREFAGALLDRFDAEERQKIAEQLMLAPLRAHAHGVDPSDVGLITQLALIVGDITGTSSIKAGTPFADLWSAAIAQDTERVIQLSELSSLSGITLVELESRGREFRLAGFAVLPRSVTTFELVARPVDNRPAAVLAHVRIALADGNGETKWDAVVSTASLSAGEWRLGARLGRSTTATVIVSVVARDRGPAVPKARGARVVVQARRQPLEVVKILVHRRILLRLAGRARRGLRRALMWALP